MLSTIVWPDQLFAVGFVDQFHARPIAYRCRMHAHPQVVGLWAYPGFVDRLILGQTTIA